MNIKKINRYENKNLAYNIFVVINVGNIIFTGISMLVNKAYPLLSFFSLIFIIVVTLPIVITKLNWAHPIMIQMLLLLLQAMSIHLRATGYLSLEFYRFNQGEVTTDLELLFIKTICINSIGLLITYFFAFTPHFKIKKTAFELKNSKAVIILLSIAWGAFYLLISRIGSIGFILENYQKRLTTFSSETVHYYVFLTQLGSIVGIYYYLVGKKKSAFFILVIQIFINLILGDRGYIIFNILIPMIIVHHYYYKEIKIKKLLPIFLITVLLYQVLGNYRSYGVFFKIQKCFFRTY